ncbi:hypothetical protein BGZ83_000288 [Gryganskiella cystojenkinii]|nr:hypothetical protein BGZ83_000288 [Gryganskiella cystojenkinii]
MSISTSKREVPSVIIVGAGLGGLMLAILFERMGVDYIILERAGEFKSLGSAMSLGPQFLPVFEQLGMLEELKQISYEVTTIWQFNENMEVLGEVDFLRLLLSKVPAQRIANGKRVLKIEENTKDNPDKVTVTCADNCEYVADVVVGADGTYSAVRQNLYKVLEAEGKLPKSDKEPLGVGYTCMVGVTEPMDPEKYPELKDGIAHFKSVVGGVRHNWYAITAPGNRFCWGLNRQYQNKSDAQRQQFMNSEWGPEANKEMIKEFHHSVSPFGGKMGDLIDATPPELISKVFLEHKMCKTWFHGRSVLIGDSCHKMFPSAGLGAINAMQDAVILANCFYDLKDKSVKSLKAAFQSYYNQRYERSKEAYNMSQMLAKVMMGQTWSDRLLRTIMLKYLPRSVQQRQFEKGALYRPQVMFLPLVENRGSVTPLPQVPCQRYIQECKDREKAKAQAI